MKTVVSVLLVVIALAVWVFGDWDRPASPEGATPAVAAPAASAGAAAADAMQGAALVGRRSELPAGGAGQRNGGAGPHDLVGIVIDPGDRSLPGAEVRLFEVMVRWPRQSLRDLGQTTTDGAGRFRFMGVPSRDLLVRAERDGLAREERYVSPAERDIRVHMSYGFDVAGTVYDTGARGMGDCEVFLEPGSWGQFAARSTRTDANGSFRFENVGAGLVRVTARSQIYRPATAPSVTVGSGVRLRLQFEQLAPVTKGLVVEAAAGHRPVAGATVQVRPGTWNSALFDPVTAVTDAAGHFELRGLGTGNLRFEVEHPEYSTTARGVTVRRDGEELTFELVGRSTLSGQLTGALQAGVLLQVDTSAGERSRVRVGRDGAFAFPDSLSAGSAQLEVEGGQLAFARSASRSVGIMIAEQGNTGVEFEMIEPSIVRGVVLDDTGRPLEGVRVSTPKNSRRDPARVTSITDADGRYLLSGLGNDRMQSTVSGEVQLTFEYDGRATTVRPVVLPPPVPVQDGNTMAGATVEVDPVQMVAAGVLEGKVLRQQQPLAGVIVFVGQLQRNQTTVSGPDGTYVLRGLAPGPYRLKARYSTLPLVTLSDSVEIVAGQRSVAPDIVMPSGRRVVGKVVEELSGLPVADAVITAPGKIAAASRTDQNGKFEIEVPELTRSLLVSSPDMSVRREISIGADQNVVAFVKLDIAPKARLRARVDGLPSRRPITHGIVRVVPDEDSIFATMPLERRTIRARAVEMSGGLLVADFVPAGKARLTLQCQGFVPVTIDLDLEPGETLTVEKIELEPGAQVYGVVLGADDAPIKGARIYLGESMDSMQRNFPEPTVETDSDGRFRIGGVAPASRRIVALADGYAPAIVDVEMPKDLLRRDSNPLPIRMQPPSTIEVQLLDADGEPADGQFVSMRKDGEMFARRLPDRDGVALFTARGPGIYEVFAYGDDEQSQRVEIGADARAHKIELRLR